MKRKQLLGAVLTLIMAFSSLHIVFSDEAVSDGTELVVEESAASDSALEIISSETEQENGWIVSYNYSESTTLTPIISIDYNGHTYTLYDDSLTWNEANNYCNSMGGYLATITSENEQSLIESLLENGNKKQYWIGLTTIDEPEWVTGETFSYSNWDNGEPNNSTRYDSESEDYVHIYNTANPAEDGSERFKWNDMFYDNIYPGEEDNFGAETVGFICEVGSTSTYTIYFENTGNSTINIDEYSEYNELFVIINRVSEGDDEVVVTSSNTEVAEVTAVEKSYLYVDDSTSYNLILSLHGTGATTLTATDTVTGVTSSYILTITSTTLEIVSVTYDDNIWDDGSESLLEIDVEFNKEISLLNGDIPVLREYQNILNIEASDGETLDYTYKADEDDPNKIIIYIPIIDTQNVSTEIDGIDYIYNYWLTYEPMTFYIDETVLTPVDSSVEFETLSFTVDLDDYNLDYPTDILSWKNSPDAFNASNYGLNSAFDSRLKLGLFVLYQWRNNAAWEGACYGMCALISLIKNGQFDIRNINLNESATNTCDLPMPRFSENIGGVRDWVNYMHFLQNDERIKDIKKYDYMPKMFSTEYESEKWSGIQGDSQEILQEVIDNAKGNNTNYIFEFAWVDPSTHIIKKHEILPFSYYYDGSELKHKIVCYDPSATTGVSIVSINNALTDFTVSNDWTDSPIEVGYTDLTDFDNIFDLSVVKPTTYLSTYSSDLSAASEEDSSDGTKISLWANSDFEIKVGDKSLLYNDGTFSGDYDIISNLDIMANGDGSSLLMFTVDDADTYVISSNSDSLDCTLETSNTYAFSQMSGSELTATFDCKNSQIISEGNISEYTVALNYDDSNMIVVSGDNETEVVVSSGDEMSVSTESGGEVALDIVNDGEKTDSETISYSNSITVVKTETGLEVATETPSTTETSSETTTETETSTETSTETTTKNTETSTETSTETTTKTSSSSSGSGGGGGGSSSTCTIKLVPNNGVNSSTTYVKKNGTLAEPDTPVYDGYTFTGWYTDSDCTTLYDFSAKVTSSFTLYGGWKVNSEDETEDTETENEAEEEEVQTETNESIIEKIVKVVIGSTIVAVETDGQESTYTMDTAPYIQSESNSTLVPLRFVAVAVYGDEVDNADSSDIVTWNSDTKTASITVGDDIISFTVGSKYMSVNGKDVLISNGVKAEITDGRMFIPFRALGEALGVEVEWDSTTKTAIYTVK
ncbi:MAG: InlB B-repeat-containing protein [Clostridiales bacterium]|nr:InlB B-repeat-containing protein [Clostridiales bacterium]